MDSAAFTGALTAAGTVAGALLGKLRTAFKAEEAIADQPKLRTEFEAHKAEDQAHHSEILTTLARIEGSIGIVQNDVSWLKDQRKER